MLYVVLEKKLYKRSFSTPLLHYLRPSDTEYALREVYEGIYGKHLEKRALVYKILQQEYHWPSIHKDILKL